MSGTGATAAYWRYRRTDAAERFASARSSLLNGAAQGTDFAFPTLQAFNWALEWFDLLAASRPEAIGLVGDDAGGRRQALRFSQLRRASDELAVRWREAGARRGDAVVVQLPNRIELWVVLLAAMKVGLVAVPLYPQASARDFQRIVDRTGALHTVTVSGPWSHGRGIDLVLDDEPDLVQLNNRARPRPFVPDQPTGSDDPLMTYLTSGTTGEPKLITHTHTTYPVGHLSGMHWQGLRIGDRHLNLSEPGWAKHSWSSFFVPWTAGAAVVAPPTTPASDRDRAVLSCLEQERVTSLCAPVHRWRALACSPGAGPVLAKLKQATTAGEAVEPELHARLSAFGVDLRTGYGQSEVTAVAGRGPGISLDQAPRTDAVGPVLPGYAVRILDENDNTVADGQSGRIVLDPVAGWPLAPSRRPDNGAYDTGDIGVLDEGWLTVLGRDDDVFKREGHRVAPVAIESVLRTYPGLSDVAVCGVPGSRGSCPHVWLEVSSTAGERGSAPVIAPIETPFEALHIWAVDRLDPVQLPVRYHLVAGLPRTASGKVRRCELPGLEAIATWEPRSRR